MINQLKTIILFAALTALFLFVGQLFGGTTGVIIALVIAILFNGLMYWFSSKIVLSLYGAKEADPKAYKELYSQVRHVAHLANIPMPKIYIIDSKTPNAFATGRNPKNGIVAFTTGILELLNKQELEGVIAHEIAHIKNRDILIQTIAATIAGAISYIASLAQWAAIFGMGDDDGPNWLQLLILIIVVPIAAMLLQLALSRSREYLADAKAAMILKSPFGLISALEKLEEGVKAKPMKEGTTATASLFIVNPFKKEFFSNLLSTHPSTKERIRRLKAMA